MKIVKLIIIGISAIGLLTGCGCDKKEEKEPEIIVNMNEGVVKDQTVEVFDMKNTSLVYEDGTTKLETTVTNTSNKEQYLKEFKIKVLDTEGNIIITLTGYVGSTIKAGESEIINSFCGKDLSKANNIVYEIIR